MARDTSDLAGRSRWAFERYWWVVALAVLAAWALAWAATAGTDRPIRYEATALVVAATVEVPPAQLARFGAAVFESGSVTDQVAQALALDVHHGDLIPDVVEVDPVPDSIVFLVHGRSEEPAEAAALADAAAEAFVVELNRAGPGIATFRLQDRARVPTDPIPGPDPVLAVAAATVAGLLLGVVAVAALVAIGRPVLRADEVAEKVDLPVLATIPVRAPGRRGDGAGEGAVHPLGAEALARRLAATPNDGVVLLGEARSRPVREVLAEALGDALPAVAPDGEGPVVVQLEDWLDRRAEATSWGLLVVIERGRPTRRLSDLVDEWQSYGAVGAVLVPTARDRAWWNR